MDNHACLIKIILISMIMFTNFKSLKAQTKDVSIKGQWEFSFYEFLTTNKDSAKLNDESKGILISFFDNSKFIKSKMINNKKVVIGSGTYKLSSDIKYLYQDNQTAQIILLSIDKLIIKVRDDLILHFKKVNE